jgi:hypothetical protein
MAPPRRLPASVADRQARSAAGEAAVGEQGAGFAQAFGFQVRGRVQHFLHARAAFRAFVADDDDVAGLHFVGEDAAHGAVLAFEDLRVAFEHVDRLVHAGGLHHAAVQGDVAVQHGQAAFLRIGVLELRMQPFSRSSSRVSQRVDWLNAVWSGCRPGRP